MTDPKPFTLAQLSALTKLDASEIALSVKKGFIPKPDKEGCYAQNASIMGAFAYYADKAKTFGPGSRLPIYSGSKQAAADTGIPLSVFQHASRNGCPAFRSNHSVSLGELLPWLFREVTDASGLPKGLVSWGDALNKEKALSEKFEREVAERKHLPAPFVEQALNQLLLPIRQAIVSIVALSPAVNPSDPQHAESHLTRWRDEALKLSRDYKLPRE